MPHTVTSSAPASEQPLVLGTGLLALDVILNADGVSDPVLAAGGTCGNVLATLSFFGWSSYPIARLNGDAASRLLQEDLSRWNVALDFATEAPPAATPIILQTIRRNARGVPTHSFSLTCPTCRSWFPRFRPVRKDSTIALLERLEKGQLRRTPDVFFFDRVSRSSLEMARHFSSRGALVMFEPSGIGKASLFEEALKLAHIVKYSSQRLPELSRRPPRSKRCALEIETRGAKGLRYRSAQTSWSWRSKKAIKGPPTVDSAGAGDWCTAGLLVKLATAGAEGLLHASEAELERAITFGQAAAAIACGFTGPRGAMYALGLQGFRSAVGALLDRRANREPEDLVEGSGSEPLSSSISTVCPHCV